MDHTEVIRLLTFLLTAMQGDIIHKFCSTRPLKQLEATETHKPQAVFLMEVGAPGRESMGGSQGLLQPRQPVGLAVDRNLLEEGDTAANSSRQDRGPLAQWTVKSLAAAPAGLELTRLHATLVTCQFLAFQSGQSLLSQLLLVCTGCSSSCHQLVYRASCHRTVLIRSPGC